MSRTINSAVQAGQYETGKAMVAIGEHASHGWLRLVRFQTDTLPVSTIIGKIAGDRLSATAFLNGTVFVIGGERRKLWRRVSTFHISSGSMGRAARSPIVRNGGHSVTTSTNEIFVCGGNYLGANNACDAFNPSTNVWRVLPDMEHSRVGFALVFLSDSRLLAIGGNYGYENQPTCEMVEIATPLAAWRPVASMRQPRYGHAAVQFDDRVLVVGGFRVISSEVFTPPPFGSTSELGQWTRIRSRMTRTFLSSRSLVVISTNEIIVFGAIQMLGGGYEGAVERLARNPILLPEEDDFDTWSWTPLPRVSHPENGFMIGVHSIN